ncbi:MAG TPA: BMP family ABC transporter substrate-binding protein [Reyranella sp.]
MENVMLVKTSWSALVMVGAMGAAVGCGKKDPNPNDAPPPSGSSAGSSAGSEAAAPAARTEPLKVAFAYVGPVGDAGWTFAHDKARRAVEAEFAGKITTSFVENVPEAADAERVIRDMAAQGAGLVFGTTFGYMEPMMKVAADARQVKFEHATGYKTAPNMRTYDARTYEGAYMVGVIAGGVTRSNTLGVVASIPIPEVIRNINAFTLGAQSVNPAVTTHVVWVNKWFDPPKEAEAAQALLNDGADVLMQNTDSSAVLQTAEKASRFGFGWDSDMSRFGPNAHLASAVIDWAPYYKKAVKDVLDGTWKTEQTWWGVKEGAIDVVSVSDKVPGPIKDKLAAVKRGLADGSFAIWKGPISDQGGKEVVAASQVASDDFLHGINFYVKGVQGNLPSAK